MRTLAIDYGLRRIGLALSDQSGTLATPLDVISAADINKILDVVREEAVEQLLVGLPLNMDDSLGPAARAAIEWGIKLSKSAGIPAIFVDERLSSFAADESLLARKRAGEKLTRKRKKEQQDALAAASFLQAFLDGKLRPVQI